MVGSFLCHLYSFSEIIQVLVQAVEYKWPRCPEFVADCGFLQLMGFCLLQENQVGIDVVGQLSHGLEVLLEPLHIPAHQTSALYL